MNTNLTESQKFWSDVGSTKNFTDPFFEKKFSNFVTKNSEIIEYGCGYGRILNNLSQLGYKNLKGFDFAPKMIERGCYSFPNLNISLIENGKVPLPDQSVDGVILSTVLCCNPKKDEQEKIITEIHRLLKKKGILYLCDFLITYSEKYLSNYKRFSESSEDYGTILSNEGLEFRHHSMHWIFNLLKDFDIQWLEQLDHVTMNGNSIRTFHLIAQK